MLRDLITNDFTVNKTRSNKILLFDLDDTLIETTANIIIMHNDKSITKITNSEFNDYVLKDGETFCFDEFEDPTILSKSNFTQYWSTLKREYYKGTHVGIITARANCSLIKNFLYNNGIDIKDELVIAVNDTQLGLESNSIQGKKAEAVGILANAGYDTFVFFDDNQPNLTAVKELESIYDITVKTIKV